MLQHTSPLLLGFSPCPNDTFVFDALVNGRIDTGGIAFQPVIADVEELNRLAIEGKTDITKLSIHAFASLTDKYDLLDAGSALGRGCGPLVVSRRELAKEELSKVKVAVPGVYTTANLLFSMAFPGTQIKIPMLFSKIEDVVLNGAVDAGLIIHEGRFTYEKKGLKLAADLSEWWEKETGLPLPLGGIAVRKTLPREIKVAVNRLVRQSVEYARANPGASREYVAAHAQETDPAVAAAHIALYVNDYTVSLGEKGRIAVREMVERVMGRGKAGENMFIFDE